MTARARTFTAFAKLLVLLPLVLCASSWGSAGDVDSGFGRFGVATLERPLQFPFSARDSPNSWSVDDIERLAGGATVVVGRAVWVGSTPSASAYGAVAVARYRRDGAVDTGFGASGAYVDTALSHWPSAVADGDQRIAIASVRGESGAGELIVIRLLSTGARDMSFAGGREVELGSSVSRPVIAAQPDRKLLIAAAPPATEGEVIPTVYRLSPDGSLDASFGSGGAATVALEHGGAFEAIALQSDGKIVLAGSAGDGAGGFEFVVARLTSSGALDPSLGGDGLVTTRFALPGGRLAKVNEARNVVVQHDGRIVVAGSAAASTVATSPYPETARRPALARFNADGSLDASFGGDGRITTWLGSESDVPDNALLLDRARIVLAVQDDRFVATRYLRDGRLDRSFGRRGFARGGSFVAKAVTQAPQRRLALAGGGPDCGFGLEVLRLQAYAEPRVVVRKRQLRARRLTLGLRANRRGVSGRVRVIAELERNRRQPSYGEWCPKRHAVGAARYRLRGRRGRVQVALTRKGRRRLNRAGHIVVHITARAGRRSGGSQQELPLR